MFPNFSAATLALRSSSTGWGPWGNAPILLLRRHPLTTSGRLESQRGEPRSGANFGTGARVAGSSVIVAGPAASNGQPLVLAVL